MELARNLSPKIQSPLKEIIELSDSDFWKHQDGYKIDKENIDEMNIGNENEDKYNYKEYNKEPEINN